MTNPRQIATDYLILRRSLGFKLHGHDRLLAEFFDFLEMSGSTAVTSTAALALATARPGASPTQWAYRLSVLRGFARGWNPAQVARPRLDEAIVLYGVYRSPIPDRITARLAACAVTDVNTRGNSQGMPAITVVRVPVSTGGTARSYKIMVDGTERARLAGGQEVSLDVAPGRHVVQACIDWTGSRREEVTLTEGDVASFSVQPNFDSTMRGLLTIFSRDRYLRLDRLREPPSV